MSILNGGMMATHTLKYKIDQPSVQLMLGCAANQVIEEQGEMIKTAFSEIEITIEEKILSKEFAEYNSYKSKTKKLIPFIY